MKLPELTPVVVSTRLECFSGIRRKPLTEFYSLVLYAYRLHPPAYAEVFGGGG